MGIRRDESWTEAGKEPDRGGSEPTGHQEVGLQEGSGACSGAPRPAHSPPQQVGGSRQMPLRHEERQGGVEQVQGVPLDCPAQGLGGV